MTWALLVVVSVALVGMARGESCEEYPVHETCLLEGVGCVWDVFSNTCHQVDKGPHCNQYHFKRQCQDVHYCNWDSHFDACHDKGGSLDCHFFHSQADCKKTPGACTWDAKLQFCMDNLGRGKGHHCQEVVDEVSCGAEDNCVWLAESNQCRSKGLGHCDGGLEASECEQVGCHWDGDHCVPSQNHILCEEKIDRAKCNKQHHKCAWQDAGSFCYNKEFENPPCHKFYESDGCATVSAHCDWLPSAHVCVPKGTPVQCDRIYEEDGCHEVAGCEWNKLAYMCHKTGVKPACEMYYERETCLQAGCEFHHHNCFTPGDFEECSKIQSRHKCERFHCKFSEAAGCEAISEEEMAAAEAAMEDTIHEPNPDEVDMDNVDMPQVVGEGEPYTSGDEIASHHTIQEQEKPDCSNIQCEEPPVCSGSDKLATPRFECCPRCSYSEETCVEFMDPGLCPSSCEWDAQHYVCLALGQPVPCDKMYEEEICKRSELGCDWHSGAWSCTNKGEKPTCERYYDKDSCPTDECVFDELANICHHKDKPVDCMHYYEQEMCAGIPSCAWDSHASTCRGAEETLDCDRYYDEDGCQAQGDRCIFVAATNRCLDTSKPLPCNAFGEDSCNAQNHCQWIATISQCDIKQDFEPLPCDEHYEEGDCKNHESGDCVWEPHSSVCHHRDVELECERHFNEEGCGASKDCKWWSVVERCTDKDKTLDCVDYHDESLCPKECEWNAHAHFCNQIGAVVPCDRMWEKDDCNKMDYCSWQEEAYMCRNKSDLGNIPCHDLSEHGACNAQKGCQWYPTSQRCLAPDAELPCDHRWSQESCDEEVGKDKCTWVANANACIKTGESISCHQIYQDDGCKATEGCGWDIAMGRCRKLREKKDEL